MTDLELTDQEFEDSLRAFFAPGAPQNLLVLLAERLPPAARYAHSLLAPLDAFDEALFDQLVKPRLEARFTRAPTGELVVADQTAAEVRSERARSLFELVVADHAQRLDDERYRIDAEYAKRCLTRLGSKSEDAPSVEEAKEFLAQVLAHWLEAAPSADFERLRLLAAVYPTAARAWFEREFAAADARFDLPRCKILCDAVARRPLVDLSLDVFALSAALSEREAYQASRSRFASEFYRSGRYYAREEFHTDVVGFLDNGPWALHLHAKGGMGKTAFLQWLVARHCVTWQARIPVARVDFDQIHIEQRRPERVAFLLAEQLDTQLPRVSGSLGPFSSLLESFKHQIPADFVEHFSAVLSEQPAAQRLVLLFDTMEECSADEVTLAPLFRSLRELCARRPLYRVLTAGRYPLSEKASQIWAQLVGSKPYELAPFSDEESAKYLRERGGLSDPEVVSAVIERAKEGLPFKLSLLAEIVQGEQLSPGAIAKLESVDLEYLIARIVLRLPERLRWALRYGVIPRVLTREVFEQVLVPHILRASGSSAELDDPTRAIPQRYEGNQVFVRKPNQDAALWDELLRYESATSWVSRGDHESLILHPDVRAPMQQLLWQQKITALIHAELADFYARQALQAKDDEAWARARVETFYHRFRSEEAVDAIGTAFVEATREVADRAPEQSHALLEVAKVATDAFEPQQSPNGDPWLTPEQWGAALMWTTEAAKELLGPNPMQDAAAWFVNVAAAARAHAPSREAQERLAVAAAEALREVAQHPALTNLASEIANLVSPLFQASAAALTNYAYAARPANLEQAYRKSKLQRDTPQSPEERAAWLESLGEFFQEALIPGRAEPRVTHAIADDYLSELYEEGKLTRALEVWHSWFDRYPEQAMQPKPWQAAAEVALRAQLPVPEAPDSVAKELYQVRAGLMRGELSESWTYQESAHFTDFAAIATEAELLARRCEDQKLDHLLGRLKQREPDPRLAKVLLRVAVWGARMSLHLIGDVKEAAAYLREGRELQFDSVEDVVVVRDLLDIEIAQRSLQDPTAALEQLRQRTANGRPRHLLAAAFGTSLALGQPMIWPACRVQPEVYEARLLSLMRGDIFDASARTALEKSRKFSRSALRAKQLAATNQLASIAQAISLYRDLGDLASAQRLERPDAAHATQAETESVAVTPESGSLHRLLAEESLGSSRALQGLTDGSLLRVLGSELFHGAEPPEKVLYDIAPPLSSLPFELLPKGNFPFAARHPCARTRHVRRTLGKSSAVAPLVNLFVDEEENERISRVTATFYAPHGVSLEQYDLRRLERGMSGDVVHLIVRLVARGRVVSLHHLHWTAISLAKMLEKTRVLVLQVAEEHGTSSIARSLLLRNAFAAELFELSQLQALVAIGPTTNQESAAPSIARMTADLIRGHLLPQDACHHLSLWSADPEAADLGSLATSAVFCDQPDQPIGGASLEP